MEKPVIGLVESGSGFIHGFLRSKYLSALAAAGLEVRILPWAATAEEAARALEGCAGLLIPGGEDVDPALYGQERHPKCGKPSPGRDRAEPLYLAEALGRDLPVLCICRGFQMLNVFRGGTLWQDVGEMEGKRRKHMDVLRAGKISHSLTITPGSLLSELHGGGTVGVNSMHHQAVKDVAPTLRVAAVSEDGVVEALEGTGAGFLLAVQWHPEHLYKRDAFANAIFKRYAEAVGAAPKRV